MRGKKRFITLTAEDKKELQDGYRRGKKATFRQRCHFILLSYQGKEVSQIAEIFSVRYQTITRWFDRYEQLGIEGLQTAKGAGRPPIIRIDNKVETDRIKELVALHPQQIKQVLPVVEREFGYSMSLDTLIRFLKKTVTPTNDSEELLVNDPVPKKENEQRKLSK
jgi:transposase